MTTGKICKNLTQARNTITQRMFYPGCAGEVTVDGSELKDGDFAGLCALQGCHGSIGLVKEAGRLYLVMREMPEDGREEVEIERIAWEEKEVRIKIETDFTRMKDEAMFYYREPGISPVHPWKKLGKTHKLFFRLDHFCGCRFGLVVFATKAAGGNAKFKKFVYNKR